MNEIPLEDEFSVRMHQMIQIIKVEHKINDHKDN